jgi:DNA polymerase I-like protein with 3'-5' exonuclease and polymerase domains
MQNHLIYAIDFETYYSKTVGINSQGTWHYLMHPEFEAYRVSIVGSNGFKFVGSPKDVDWKVICEADVWVSHNASFDEPVYHFLQQTEQIEAPEVTPVWQCTADLSAFLASPRSLKQAAGVLLNEEVTKDIRDAMKGKRWTDMTPEFQKEVDEYALKDSELCLRLWLEFSDKWPEHERRISHHTREMGAEGLMIDKDSVEEGITTLRRQIWEAEQKIPWADTDAKTLSAKALAIECRNVGIEPPSSLAIDSEECAAWEEKYGDQYPWVGAMRTYRRCNALLKKVENINNRIRPDGRLGYSLMYCGAHTGRFSGGGSGINFQNLPREELFGVNLRGMIVAPKDKKLIIADLAQIEPRVLAWFAEDWETLKMVESGVDIYESHARMTMGYDLDISLKQAAENDPKYKKLRQLAKARVLGLGYGCGPDKFVIVAKTLAGLDITREESEVIVSNWRESNPKIIAFWRKLENHFKMRVPEPVEIGLPSGREIRYRDTQSLAGNLTARIPRQGKLIPVKIWGGVICENVVQGASRDVFCDGVLRLEDAGYKVILTVHDEVVVEAEPHQSADEVVKILCQTPEWMPGLPVDAEAVESSVYVK